MSITRITRGVLCLVCLLALGGCGDSGADRATGGGAGDGAADTLRIAVIPKSTSGEFWRTVEGGVQQAGRDLGVTIIWEGTVTETEIAEQNRVIETMVAQGVDGIALAPLNQKAMQKQVRGAVDAGVPVVVFDSAVDGEAHTSFVATDNTQGGALGAQHLLTLLGDSKRVVVLRYVQGTGSTEARAAGFIETAGAGGCEIIADAYPDNGQIEGCKTTAANTLARYVKNDALEVDGIFAANLISTLGMLSALEDLEKSGVKVSAKFVGFDTSPKLVDALREGKVDALVAQDPQKMGYLAVQTLVKHLRGESVPKVIDTGVVVVTAAKLESDPAIRKLVGLEQ